MYWSNARPAARLAALGLLVTACVFGQTATGTLDGRVNDSSGSAVPGAKVVIENQATGIKADLTTNSEGRFYQGFVLPGSYRLTAEKSGFQKYVESGITVSVNQTVSLTVNLNVGDVSTSVEVSSQAAQLTTEASSISTTVSNKSIQDLPLNGRNVFGLATLVPGVIPGGGGSTPFISGGRNATNEITIDGTSVILPENNVSNLQTGYTPIVDSVQEFSIVTNALEAQYGRTGGGVINVATRGGTNGLHISAYDYLRNSKLNTNTWNNNRNGVKLAAFQSNQFGGTIGGPITIPHIYDGKNRTFFFFSEQTQRNRTGATSSASVPIADWINGDYSKLVNGVNQPISIYDPLTAADDGTGTYKRLPFAGNKIPTSRFDPVAVNLLKYYPTPNATPTNAFALTNNFYASGKSVGDDDKFDSRIDHAFTNNFRMFARGSYDHGESVPLNGFGNVGTSIGDGKNISDLYNVTVNGIYTLNSTTILNMNYGFARNVGIRYPFSEGTSPASLGFPSSYAAIAGISNFEFPNISFGGNNGVSNLGQSTFTTLVNRPMSHIVRGDVTKVFSKHTLKAGGEWRKFLLNFTQLGQPDGAYNFNGNYTQQVVGSSANSTQGFGVAQLLLGVPSSGSITHSFDAAMASSYAGVYIQDDWKVTQKLTLNMGLRYDVDVPRTERYNRLSYWDITAPSPIAGKVAASAICPNCGNLLGAMMFTRPGHRRQVDTDKNNFGPRFGFAYHVLPKTVVRGAYGILYSPSVTQASGTSGSGGVEGFQSTSNMNVSFDNGRTVAAFLKNPFPAGYNLPLGSVVGPISGPSTDLGLSIGDSFFNDSQNPLVQQWNFNIQQEVKGGWIVDVGYLGSKGQHLVDGESNMSWDQLPASALALGSKLTQSVPNPFLGIITNTTSVLSQPNVLQRYLLAPYPQYTGVNAFRKPQANSIYHSFTLSAEHRYSHGIVALVSFTGGKLIDDASQVVTFLGAAGNKQDFYCRKCEKSVSAQDVSKRLVTSVNYELPFGKGKTYFNSMPRAVDFVLGGWQMNGIMTFQKGLPIAISNGGNNTNIGSPGQRPNTNGTNAAKSGAIADRLNSYFDQTAFSAAPIYTFGNLGRFVSNLRGPGQHNLDFSLFKSFRFREKATVVVRAEAFNFTNSPTWNGPGTTVTSPGTFGVITSANGQRQVQLAMKLNF
jgi:hypothetical protein